MKPTKYILLLVFSLVFTANSIAQIKKRKAINTGFLFINGQYIETPYIVKRKGFSVYINNIRIYTENTEPKKNPLKSYTKRLSTPHCINKNSTKSDFHNCRDTVSKELYYHYMSKYFLKHYPYKQAIDSFIHYLESYPNVKSIDTINGPPITINLYNGESWNYMYPGFRTKEISQKWGPNGTGDKIDKEKMKLSLDYVVELYSDALLANTTEIINVKEHYFNIVPTMGKKYTAYIYHIMQKEGLTKDQKFDSLNLLIYGEKELRYFVNNYKITPQYIKRIKEIGFDTLRYTKEQVDIKNKSSYNNKNIKNTDCYSPSNNIVKIWCAYNHWDVAFNKFNLEYEQITKKIEGLGYTNIEIYTDDVANDELNMDYGSCTYQNLKDMKNAGLIYFGAHGSENGYILVQMSYDPNELFDGWAQSNNNVTIAEIPPSDIHNYEYAGNDGWDTQVYAYGAFINYQWFNENWKTELTNSNAIVFSSVCYGANNNLLDSYGGGVAFAYCETTDYNDAIHNNPRLIKRMNGQLDNGENREAYDAFNNFNSQGGFSINSNSKITLCPAPTTYTEGEVDLTGTGYFELDTWCSTNNPADGALIIHETEGNVQISNIHWVSDSDPNKSKRIEYDWVGTGSFFVKFHVNPLKIKSYSSLNPTGQGVHALDFNKVTPNGISDLNISYFSITHEAEPTSVDFEADNQYVLEGETVQFTNTSTINNQNSFIWDFGDGYSSSDENPTHTYYDIGQYDVSLIINNEIEIKSGYIVVHGDDDGSIECYNTFLSNKTVQFNAQYLDPPDPNNTYIFSFNFGDGTSYEEESSLSNIEITYDYPFYGNFEPNVQIKMLNENNDTIYDSYCSCGNISIDPPSCDNFTATIHQYPDFAIPGNSVEFTVSANGIPPYTYQWWFLPSTNGNPSIEMSTDENPYVTFSDIGNYYVAVQVTDALGCGGSAEYNIAVSNPETCYPNTKVECWNSSRISNTVFVKKDCALNFSFEHNFDDYHCHMDWGCDEPEIGIWNVYRYWTSFYYNQTPKFYEFFSHTIVSDQQPEYGCFDVLWAVDSEKDFSFRFTNPDLYKVRITIKKECADSQYDGDVICHPPYYDNYEYKSIADILVHCVDCGIYSGFRTNGNDLSNDVVGIGPTFSAGNFWLSSNDNTYLQNNDVILTACNEIVMCDGFNTGTDGLFIAQTGSSVFEECDNNLKFNNYTIENKHLISSTLNAYPNPFDNKINIEIKLKKTGVTKIDLCNIEGKKIRTLLKQNLTSNTNYSFSFELKNVDVGAYLIKIMQNNELLTTKKIIKKQ